MKSSDEKWILCPICGAKTRARLLSDTVLRNFPLFCPKCRRESIINAELVGTSPSITLTRDRPVTQSPHWGLHCSTSLRKRKHYHIIVI